jgi:hypothetical protein
VILETIENCNFGIAELAIASSGQSIFFIVYLTKPGAPDNNDLAYSLCLTSIERECTAASMGTLIAIRTMKI